MPSRAQSHEGWTRISKHRQAQSLPPPNYPQIVMEPRADVTFFHNFFLRVQCDFSISSYNVHSIALLVNTVMLEVLPRMLLGLLADAGVCNELSE